MAVSLEELEGLLKEARKPEMALRILLQKGSEHALRGLMTLHTARMIVILNELQFGKAFASRSLDLLPGRVLNLYPSNVGGPDNKQRTEKEASADHAFAHQFWTVIQAAKIVNRAECVAPGS